MFESTKREPAPDGEPGARWAAAMAEHERLVHWVVQQQDRGALRYVDAVHEGRIGLWRALQRYDPRRGTCFSTYAVPAIRHAVWAAVAGTRAAPAVPLEAAAALGVDPIAACVTQLDQAAWGAVLGDAVAQLPAELRQVVVAHLGLEGQAPQTFAAIGQQVGRTRQRIQQRYVAALERLAHPAHSLPLRQLVERATRWDYQQTLGRQQRRARARRAGQRGAR